MSVLRGNSRMHFVGLLFRFMLIFGINRFEVLSVSQRVIRAKVGWPDEGQTDYAPEEEIQEIEWAIQPLGDIDLAIDLAEWIVDRELIRGDKIVLNKADLAKRLGWNGEEYERALSALLEIRVDMVDEGRRTDYFFVHF